MGSAFEDTADFSKMIKEGDPLKISKVKQKTFIDVNEEGTEAAAVTSIEMVTEDQDPSMNHSIMEVNRPFFFTITDDETDTILFMGAIPTRRKRSSLYDCNKRLGKREFSSGYLTRITGKQDPA